MEERRKYFVHVELALATADRVAEAAASVAGTLHVLSQGDMVAAHRSLGRDQFGFFVKTKMKAAQIRAALNAPTGPANLATLSAFRSGDRVLIVEVGSDAVDIGKGNAVRWLQNH